MADADIDRERMRRDAAGVGPYAREDEELVPLSELDHWDVAEGEPDIRGWEVRTIGGRDLGKIKDLLVDPDAREVVMLDVDLSGTSRHALVPIRIVQVDRAARVVRMDSADLTPSEREAAREAAVETDRERDRERPSATEEARAAAETARVERRRRWADTGQVRFPQREEVVVERRPMVEEVVVRRRLADDVASNETDAQRAAEDRPDRPEDRA